MTVRSEEAEEQLSNELEAHYREWQLAGAGESNGQSIVWISRGSTPHPDLIDWCAKHDFDIQEWPER